MSVAHSLSYQSLPPSLLAPLMEGVLTVSESSHLWDLMLLSTEDWIEAPQALLPAVQRLNLWQVEISPTRH